MCVCVGTCGHFRHAFATQVNRVLSEGRRVLSGNADASRFSWIDKRLFFLARDLKMAHKRGRRPDHLPALFSLRDSRQRHLLTSNMSATKQGFFMEYQEKRFMEHQEAFIVESEDAILARLLVLRNLPLDITERIERLVRHAEWRVYRDAHTHLWQTKRTRRNDLLKELTRLGCELRDDSRLCSNFIAGSPGPARYGVSRLEVDTFRKWSAKSVSRRMNEMKYVYQYCAEYARDVSAMETEAYDAANAYGDPSYGDSEDEDDCFELGCQDTCGYRTLEQYNRALAEGWTEFPTQWPWLTPEQLKANAERGSESDGESSSDDDEDDEDNEDEDDEEEEHECFDENEDEDFDDPDAGETYE